MANVVVKVLSARYVYGGNTYVRGDTFEIPGEESIRTSGIKDSLSRGNIIMVGANDVVQNAASNNGKVQVDLEATTTTPIGEYCDPRTTNVTGEDFVTEGPNGESIEDIPEVAPDDVIGNALKSALKTTTGKKPSRSTKKQ